MSHQAPLPIMKLTEQTRTLRARWAIVCCALVPMVFPVAPEAASAATHRSANFTVTAESKQFAETVAAVAEEHRQICAEEFLGTNLSDWKAPCRITVTEQPNGGKGWTSYEIFRGKVENIHILVNGRRDHIIDYLIPHEVAHAVLAVSLGRVVPRWADEGIALLCETETQLARQRTMAAQLASQNAIMPLAELLQLAEYPADRDRIIDFYASSFSLAEFLVHLGGKVRLLKFLKDGGRDDWESSMRKYYGYADRGALEADWKAWACRESSSHLVQVAPHSEQGPAPGPAEHDRSTVAAVTHLANAGARLPDSTRSQTASTDGAAE